MATNKQKLESILKKQIEIDQLQERIDILMQEKSARIKSFNAPFIKRIEKVLRKLLEEEGTIDLQDCDVSIDTGDIDYVDADEYQGGEIVYHLYKLKMDKDSQRVLIRWWHSLGAHGSTGEGHTEFFSDAQPWVIREIVNYLEEYYGEDDWGNSRPLGFGNAAKSLIDEDEDSEYYNNMLLFFASSIVIPDTVQEIEDRAYECFSNLKKVLIPHGVTEIGAEAFSGCSRLVDVYIPDSVVKIGYAAFSDCSSLESVRLPDGLEVVEWNLFRDCSSLKEVAIPPRVVSIKSGAFKGCTGLKSIQLPSHLDHLGSSAFCDCESLEEIVVPEGVRVLEKDLFNGCVSLRRVILPGTLESIEDGCSDLSITGVFSYCQSLEEIIIPKGVTRIGKDAFFGCASLQRISVPQGLEVDPVLTSLPDWVEIIVRDAD